MRGGGTGSDTGLEASGVVGLTVLEEPEDRGHFQKHGDQRSAAEGETEVRSGRLWRLQQGSVGVGGLGEWLSSLPLEAPVLLIGQC